MKMKVLHLILSCFICTPTQQYCELTDFFPPATFHFHLCHCDNNCGKQVYGSSETQIPSLMNLTSAFLSFEFFQLFHIWNITLREKLELCALKC